jgi:hypothetical protein
MKEETKKKIKYFLDEAIVLLFSIGAIMLSEAVKKRMSGEKAVSGDIYYDWLNVIISGIIAIIVYSSMYIKFDTNFKDKPPLIKRIANAILQGIAWQSNSKLD